MLGAGDAERYTSYPADERRTVVTEYMLPGTTFDMTWTPLAPGGWLFHCHYMLHMGPELAVPKVVKAGGHAHAAEAPREDARQLDSLGMGGLVLMVSISPSCDARLSRLPGPAQDGSSGEPDASAGPMATNGSPRSV
ncbi:MAG: multicopper oxidase domain-containing protein [Acidobacteriota bacterium]